MDSFELNEASTSNELFLERLDAFTAKTLADIKAFSTRENIPYDQVGYAPVFPHRVTPKLLYLRFGVRSQRDTPNTSSATQPLYQVSSRIVRLGATLTLCFFEDSRLLWRSQSVTFFYQLPGCWSPCKLRPAYNLLSSLSILMTQKMKAFSAGAHLVENFGGVYEAVVWQGQRP